MLYAPRWDIFRYVASAVRDPDTLAIIGLDDMCDQEAKAAEQGNKLLISYVSYL